MCPIQEPPVGPRRAFRSYDGGARGGDESPPRIQWITALPLVITAYPRRSHGRMYHQARRLVEPRTQVHPEICCLGNRSSFWTLRMKVSPFLDPGLGSTYGEVWRGDRVSPPNRLDRSPALCPELIPGEAGDRLQPDFHASLWRPSPWVLVSAFFPRIATYPLNHFARG